MRLAVLLGPRTGAAAAFSDAALDSCKDVLPLCKGALLEGSGVHERSSLCWMYSTKAYNTAARWVTIRGHTPCQVGDAGLVKFLVQPGFDPTMHDTGAALLPVAGVMTARTRFAFGCLSLGTLLKLHTTASTRVV